MAIADSSAITKTILLLYMTHSLLLACAFAVPCRGFYNLAIIHGVLKLVMPVGTGDGPLIQLHGIGRVLSAA